MIAFVDHEDGISPNLNLDYCIVILQTRQPNFADVEMDLNKQYLNLQYRITQHKFSGDTPPDGLLREISNIERKVRLIARALE